MLANIATALSPVVVFLVAMIFMDGYKLVPARTVLLSMAAGCMAALLALPINTAVFSFALFESSAIPRYITPVSEELLKALPLGYVIATRRVGFLVDAAIVAFAVGAGFAIYENIYFLHKRPDADMFVWIVRGFGTAIMHGSASAVMGIVSQSWAERRRRIAAWHFLPGLALAVFVHSMFNHFFISPALTAAGLLVGLPLLMWLVFRTSNKSIQRWLGVGFDTDAEMLRAIGSGRLTDTPVGQYLLQLRQRFPAEVVADIFCLLRLTVELSVEAKGMMLLRKKGFKLPPSPEIGEKLEEVSYLEKSIGPTGRLAVRPLLSPGRRDFWQRQLLS